MMLNFGRGISIILFVAIFWVLLYQLNTALFHSLYLNQLVSWIFIPQGLRIIAVIIFAELGVIGIFLGSLATTYIYHTDINDAFQLALISAINPYLAVHTARYLLNVDSLYTDLNARKLVFISFISAIFNSVFHQSYIHIRVLAGFANDVLVMFAGDFFGSLVLLYLMSATLKYIKFQYSKIKLDDV